jgi:hypothetical protein
MEVMDMTLSTITDINKEIERRRIVREDFQIKLDIEELDRRVHEYEVGHSTLISSQEMWKSLEQYGSR